jgi:hypothetical protein
MRRPGFNLRAVDVGLEVDKVPMGLAFLGVFLFSHVNYLSNKRFIPSSNILKLVYGAICTKRLRFHLTARIDKHCYYSKDYENHILYVGLNEEMFVLLSLLPTLFSR